MRPDSPPNACWTSFIGAPTHNLGDLPEKCFTCAAKRREDEKAALTRLGRLLSSIGQTPRKGMYAMPLCPHSFGGVCPECAGRGTAPEPPAALHECYYCVGRSDAERRTCEYA